MIGLRVIFLNKNILKYNHLQPPEAAGFDKQFIFNNFYLEV